MPKNKNIPIKYTSREFESIKKDIIEHAKRYYPDIYNDFSEASFGSLVFDSVAYVGDILSFYLDYSVNESFLDTAVEFVNVRKHAKTMGYSFAGVPVSSGEIACFILVPANSEGNAPDLSYLPVLKKGSEFSNNRGVTYTLMQDIVFNRPENDKIAVRFDPDEGKTTHYGIRAYGPISSGKSFLTKVDLTNSQFEKFKKIRIGDSSITEIISVVDSEGNRFYEVDFLSQESVMIETTNQNAANDGVRSILKPFVTARRFTFYQDDTGTYLQFGFGSDGEDDSGLVDPSKVVLKLHGRDHITHTAIDPTKLLGTDKLGISPQGTVLSVVYRKNDGTFTNSGTQTINTVSSAIFRFRNESSLVSSTVDEVKNSLEATNEMPIVGSSVDFTTEELKVRSKNLFASQNRAVTKSDYEAISYNMPTKFGQIKRVNIINDPFATNKKLAMYVVSEDENSNLVQTPMVTKQNLRTWLNQYIGINDIIEMFDAKIINFSISFKVQVDNRYDRTTVLSEAIGRIKSNYSEKFYIGEPIYLNKIYNILSKTEGVVDVINVNIQKKTSIDNSTYSSTSFFFQDVLSADGTFYKAPKNVVYEIKFPDDDITGTAI